jgi:hypothetical protein
LWDSVSYDLFVCIKRQLDNCGDALIRHLGTLGAESRNLWA